MSHLDDTCSCGLCDSHAATIARLTAEVERLRARCGRLAAISRRTHHECEDSWYSCPKSEDGCADDFKTGCTCGAEEHNAMIDAICNDLKEPTDG